MNIKFFDGRQFNELENEFYGNVLLNPRLLKNEKQLAQCMFGSTLEL